MSVWTDQEVLRVMWRVGTVGQSAGEVCLAFDTTRSAICGLVKRVRDAGRQVEALGLGDLDRLYLLDAMLAGASAAHLGSGCGLSRYGVLHLVSEILRESAEAGPDLARKAENNDRVAWPAWCDLAAVRGHAA